jgi:hypothetical protein
VRVIYNFEQGTDEWRNARLGIPTASQFGTVLAKGRAGADSKGRRTYMLKLAGERLTGELAESFSNVHTDRGHAMEPEAIAAYAFMHDCEPETVGFIRLGDVGCSPDRLVGDTGLVEAKSRLPHIQIETLEADKVPPSAMPQLQGQLWICEREWVDYLSYCPRLPLFVKRVYRDEEYIKRLDGAIQEFNEELAALVSRYEGRA